MMENNSILNYKHEESVGTIWSVDTGTAIAHIEKEEELSKLQVNQLIAILSPHPGRHIIGMISAIPSPLIS